MRTRAYHCSPFPGRKAVLAAVKETGSWNTRQMFAWAKANGGSADTYAALAWWVRKGKLTYSQNVWTVC